MLTIKYLCRYIVFGYSYNEMNKIIDKKIKKVDDY